VKSDYDTAVIGNGLFVRTRRRPEYTKRTLGANAPTFRVSLAVVQSLAPVKIDPAVCSVPSGCDGKVSGALDSGEFRCGEHLVSAARLGCGIVFCSWCDANSLPPNGSHGICRHHSEKVQAEYLASKGRTGELI